MLADVLPVLCCPLCRGALGEATGAVRCPAGHTFDVARQGYVNLLTGGAHAGTADTSRMVAARAAFLESGYFARLAASVADHVKNTAVGDGCVLDIGAGTGYYLRAVLERSVRGTGVALDISKYALRRAARAHPRIGAVVWDAWRPLPVRTGVATAVLDVFAPRNPGEFHRVLRPGGVLIIVIPTARHLGELVGELGLLSVDARKDERIADTLGGRFTVASTHPLDISLRLSRREVAELAAMGPSARHVTEAELVERVAELPEPVSVTASFLVLVARPRNTGGVADADTVVC